MTKKFGFWSANRIKNTYAELKYDLAGGETLKSSVAVQQGQNAGVTRDVTIPEMSESILIPFLIGPPGPAFAPLGRP